MARRHARVCGRLPDDQGKDPELVQSREALDAAYKLRPDDATVALALGQWCLKVAGVSFVERGLARAIFGGSPPESTYAEALKFFRKAQELKPASKTKALIKPVEGKMRNGGK